MNRMITAPITQAQIAPGPAICAARQAPNSQPEPMIEPRPVSIRANGPTSRRIELLEDMETPGARAAHPRKESMVADAGPWCHPPQVTRGLSSCSEVKRLAEMTSKKVAYLRGIAASIVPPNGFIVWGRWFNRGSALDHVHGEAAARGRAVNRRAVKWQSRPRA